MRSEKAKLRILSFQKKIKFLAALITAALVTTLSAVSTSANEAGPAWNSDSRAYSQGWPWPPLPNWWSEGGTGYEAQRLTNLRLGFWLPCRVEWAMNDCIERIEVSAIDGAPLGELTFVPNTEFDPFQISQRWLRIKTKSDENLDNNVYWDTEQGKLGTSLYGYWLLPDGVTTTSGGREVDFVVQRMLGGIQTLLQSRRENGSISQLPEDLIFKVILRSKVLAKHARWIHSNGKDPRVTFAKDGAVAIRGITAKSPWVPGGADVCKAGNEVRAIRDEVFMAVNITLDSPGVTQDSQPGEVIIGTNGWWCFGGITWDARSSSLVANVGTAHYFSDGSVVDGWLEVKINAKRVRQWWGISPEEASGYARVEVSYADGTTKVATVSAKYLKSADLIDLRAYGFTYSKPAVRITFKKPTTRITCVKGLVVKKLARTNCPAGYRRR